MNLVYITCAVRPTTETSCFSGDVRILQIVKSIESVRNKVPNCFIVLLETGSASNEEKEFLTGLVNLYMTVHVTTFVKSMGEATMIYRFLSSSWFQENKQRFSTYSKLSGRYFLTDSFDFSKYPLDKIFIRFRWGGESEGLFETRYYRIPGSKIDLYAKNLENLLTNHAYVFKFLDIEHLYFLLNFFPLEETIHDQTIGLAGWITGNGQYLEE